MGSTQRFGLLTLDNGVGLASEGNRFGTADRRTIDRVLAALESHDHFGGTRLADPVGVPVGQTTDVGGALPGGLNLYYRVSFVDQFGLETAPSSEILVQTPARLTPPTAPVLTPVNGGSLSPGVHYYALTVEKDGYSTPLGPNAVITLLAGQGSVSIDLPDPPAGASGFGIWRLGPTDSYFTKIATTLTDPSVDDGSVPASDCPTDPGNLPPTTNRTNGTNKVTITCPDPAVVGAVGSAVRAWRIYRTEQSGVYQGNSLVAEVATLESGALVTEYEDLGQNLLPGVPKTVSQTLTPSVALTSSTGQAVALIVSDGAGYQRVIADASGNLVTRDTDGSGPGVFLTDADEETWEVTAVGGALSTSVGSPAFGDAVFGNSAGPVLPTSDPTVQYRLGVRNDGTLTTTYL